MSSSLQELRHALRTMPAPSTDEVRLPDAGVVDSRAFAFAHGALVK